MKKTLLAAMTAAATMIAAMTAAAQTPPPPAPAPAPPTVQVPAPAPADAPATISTVDVAPPPANALPPMKFVASVAEDELYQGVKSVPAFSQLDKDLVGSQIVVVVTHGFKPTAAGQATGFLSALVSGSTLGLIPLVTNNNLVLTYEIRVNGDDIVRRDYERSFTRVQNIWANKDDPTHGLGAEGLEWARTTSAQFANEAAVDPAVLALAAEYRQYFGDGSSMSK
jgi:hypothetical protein